jgi:LuxR family transcriptional regulator, maltose regulon positive regulatory protein
MLRALRALRALRGHFRPPARTRARADGDTQCAPPHGESARELLRRRPDLGTLTGEARALRARLSEERGPSVPGPSALTAAELRILPLLATHLSYPEIATELILSKHTIKSQAHSLYRKLGATSRSQAVTRSRTLALLDE